MLNSSPILTFASIVTAFTLWRKNQDLSFIKKENRASSQVVLRRKPKKSNQRQHSKHQESSDDSSISRNLQFTLNEIGLISSPFPQRAGCPRQGLLAHNVRSHLTLHSDVVMKETLDDLDQYSHVWIIFQFHLNPMGKARNVHAADKALTFHSSKVCPPRANGEKVGVFATRSPHRPNAIGLSLAKIESIETEVYIDRDDDKKHERGGHRKERKRTVLKLLGCDLVDQTPVYDIKPYIPSDAIQQTNSVIKYPEWVIKDDTISTVRWKDEAKDDLHKCHGRGLLAPFYPITTESSEEEAFLAISQVIAQDPRANYEGRGKASCLNSVYEITFCRTRVSFCVMEDEVNDGGETLACVVKIMEDEGDSDAIEGSYQHTLAQLKSGKNQ